MEGGSQEGGHRSTRRQFLKGVGALAGLAAAGGAAGYGAWRAFADGGDDTAATGAAATAAEPTLDDLAANIVHGGPGRGGIPAIDEPRFLPAREADFLADDDFVFGLVRNGETKAYPQLVLVWHEIVNDVVGGEALAVTYCPLTGSVVAFGGRAPDGTPYTFNTTGNLVNSNLLMFDRQTDSEWPQILGRAILGPQRGERLAHVPLVWATWGRWREQHPDSAVLSTETGFGRPYGSDPYGSYSPRSGYYEPDSPPIFAVIGGEDERFPPKEVVVGIKGADVELAVRKRAVERARVFPLALGGERFVAFWEGELATARVFRARAGDRPLRFSRGSFRDSTTGTTWSATGRATRGAFAGERLPPADFFDVMWFAWAAFFPRTRVVR